jgi:hypothetical protein
MDCVYRGQWHGVFRYIVYIQDGGFELILSASPACGQGYCSLSRFDWVRIKATHSVPPTPMDHRRLPCRLDSGIVLLALLMGWVFAGCVNPVEGTYKKGVEGGQEAIQKAQKVQELVDQENRRLQVQQKQMEAENPPQK